MLWNVKCLLRAFRGQSSYEQILNLLNITSMRKYQKDVLRVKKLLSKCTNSYYVNDDDKKELRQPECTLNRSHLTWLMHNDPDLIELQTTGKDHPKVYMNQIEYSFGLIQNTVEQILDLHYQIQDF